MLTRSGVPLLPGNTIQIHFAFLGSALQERCKYAENLQENTHAEV